MDLLRPPNNVTEFALFGLIQNPHLHKILFIVFLFIFLFTVLASLLTVITISLSPALSAHKYFFSLTCLNRCLSHICCYTQMIIPLLYQGRITSCISLMQIFLAHFLGDSDIIVLTVMAYDHYVDIHKPLHYTTIMREGLCQRLVVVAWTGGILPAMVQILFMVDLTFCGFNVVDHFMCDFISLLEIACSDTYKIGMVVTANSEAMCLLIFFLFLISYIVILSSLKF